MKAPARAAIAYHEAGHAVVAVSLRGFVDGFVVTIDAESALLTPGTLGLATAVGVDQSGRSFRDPSTYAEEDRQVSALLMAISTYSGIACQYPCATGIPLAALAHSANDRMSFAAYLKTLGLVGGEVDHVAWLAATRYCDDRWGAVVAVAEALLERGTLHGPEIAALAAAAPSTKNTRAPWCEGDALTQPERAHAWSGLDLPPWPVLSRGVRLAPGSPATFGLRVAGEASLERGNSCPPHLPGSPGGIPPGGQRDPEQPAGAKRPVWVPLPVGEELNE